MLAQVIARWAAHGEPLAGAVEAPRFHAEDTEVEVEQPLAAAVVGEDLLARGYSGISLPELPYYWGSVQALEIDHEGGGIAGADDPRREGTHRVATGDR